MSKLLAAALLKDDLDGDDKIHAALFSVAFGEWDELRKELAQIPVDVDASATRFQRVTTQAVDDFVAVANEALSKFIHRTNEIKAALDVIQPASIAAAKEPAKNAPVVAPGPVEIHASSGGRLWAIVAGAFAGGVVVGVLVAGIYFALK